MNRVLYTIILLFSISKFSAQSLSVQLSKTHYQCNKGTAGIQILSGSTPISWSWSNGESNVSSISELEAGDYYVQIRDASQKDTTIYFKIEKFECQIFVQNHFTPNGDNFNDTWNIYLTEFHPRFKLHVYNKWGQQVHTQSGKYVPWDGTQGGVAVPDGTYYYIFYYEANDDRNYVKGDVTILR